MDREQEELLSLSLKGFPDGLVIQENSKINQYRDNLKKRQTELSRMIADAKQAEFELYNISLDLWEQKNIIESAFNKQKKETENATK